MKKILFLIATFSAFILSACAQQDMPSKSYKFWNGVRIHAGDTLSGKDGGTSPPNVALFVGKPDGKSSVYFYPQDSTKITSPVQGEIISLMQDSNRLYQRIGPKWEKIAANIAAGTYTDEKSMDATAGVLKNTTSITWVYNDGGDTLNGVVNNSYVRAQVSAGDGAAYNATTGVVTAKFDAPTLYNIDSLRASDYYTKLYNNNSHKFVRVSDYWSLGSGGGGDFWFDAASTEADNGGNIIKPTAIGGGSPGRWKRYNQGDLSLLDFGAKQDGVTDCRASFKAALAVAYVTKQRIFINPGGHFFMSDSIEIYDQVIIFGIREKSVIQMAGHKTAFKFKISASESYLLDFTVQGTSGNGSPAITTLINPGIISRTILRCRGLRVQFFDGDGMDLQANLFLPTNHFLYGNTSNSSYEACSFYYNGGNGAYIRGDDASNMTFTSCDFRTNGRAGLNSKGFLGNHAGWCHTASNSARAGNKSVVNIGDSAYYCLMEQFNTFVNRAGVTYRSIAPSIGVEPTVTAGWATKWVAVTTIPGVDDWVVGGSYAPQIRPGTPGWSHYWYKMGGTEFVGPDYTPAYDSTQMYLTTGSYVEANGNGFGVYSGCYSEGGQAPNYFAGSNFMLGGDNAAGWFNQDSPEYGRYQAGHQLWSQAGTMTYDGGFSTRDQYNTYLMGMNTAYGMGIKEGTDVYDPPLFHRWISPYYMADMYDTALKVFRRQYANSAGYSPWQISGFYTNPITMNVTDSLLPGGLTQNRAAKLMLNRVYFKSDSHDGSSPYKMFGYDLSAPSVGEKFGPGDYVKYSGTDTTIQGFLCIAAGNPGTWKTIYTGNYGAGNNYIRNQSSVDQSASFRITGSGRVDNGFQSRVGSDDSSSFRAGYQALKVGVTGTINGQQNVAIGYQAMSKFTLGNLGVPSGAGRNVAIGYMALANDSAYTNGSIGRSDAAQHNVVIGAASMSGTEALNGYTALAKGNGSNNTAVGFDVMPLAQDADGNIAIGMGSLVALTTGDRNIAIGGGSNTTTGSENILIGADAPDTAASGLLRIGGLIEGDFYNHKLTINGSFQTVSGSVSWLGAVANKSQFLFNSSNGSIRGGYNGGGTEWSQANSGNYSVAFGYQPKASGLASIAIGSSVGSFGNGSVAMGLSSHADSTSSIAIGKDNASTGIASVALGFNNNVAGNYSTALGSTGLAPSSYSTVGGNGSAAYADASTAIGWGLLTNKKYETVFGKYNDTIPSAYKLIDIGWGTPTVRNSLFWGDTLGRWRATYLTNGTYDFLLPITGHNDTLLTWGDMRAFLATSDSAVIDLDPIYNAVYAINFHTIGIHKIAIGQAGILTTGTDTIPGIKSFNTASGYLTNLGSTYTARSFTDKNYVDSSSAGALINIQTLTGGTTYTPTTGTKTAVIYMVGGGGGGGGTTGSNANVASAAGGGSGGYLVKRITGVSGTYTYALGSAGTAGTSSGGAGGGGGNTTFTNGGTTYTAFGGGGGNPMTFGTTLATSGVGAGAAVSTNGDLNSGGTPGAPGIRLSGTIGVSGNGGSSQFGSGGAGITTGLNGNPGIGYGAGGAGGLSNSSSASSGGVGTAGVIVVYEYR